MKFYMIRPAMAGYKKMKNRMPFRTDDSNVRMHFNLSWA